MKKRSCLCTKDPVRCSRTSHRASLTSSKLQPRSSQATSPFSNRSTPQSSWPNKSPNFPEPSNSNLQKRQYRLNHSSKIVPSQVSSKRLRTYPSASARSLWPTPNRNSKMAGLHRVRVRSIYKKVWMPRYRDMAQSSRNNANASKTVLWFLRLRRKAHNSIMCLARPTKHPTRLPNHRRLTSNNMKIPAFYPISAKCPSKSHLSNPGKVIQLCGPILNWQWEVPSKWCVWSPTRTKTSFANLSKANTFNRLGSVRKWSSASARCAKAFQIWMKSAKWPGVRPTPPWKSWKTSWKLRSSMERGTIL